MRRTTWPPRWIRPRIGGLAFSSVPRPGAPASLRHRPGRPFGHFFWLPFVPSYDIDLVDLHFALQLHRWHLGDQATAQLLRHRLHIRDGQAQLTRDLPVGKVQAHEVKAQDPHPQRLVVPGQHRAGQVVETARTRLAPITLAKRLRVVAPVPDH